MLLLLGALAIIGTIYALVNTSTAARAAGAPHSETAVEEGRALYLEGCASCHGLNAEGTSVAPSLIGDSGRGMFNLPAPASLAAQTRLAVRDVTRIGDDVRVIAGQGTASLELFADAGDLDALVVPVGGGGLIAGCAVVASSLAPGCRVIGAEPEASGDSPSRSGGRKS